MAEFTQTPLDSVTPSPAPSPAPLSPMPHRMTRRVFRWLIILAVALAAISVYLFFFGGSSFTESKVDLTIDGPSQISVGDLVAYKVHYQNNTKTTLHHVTLSITYPDGAVIMNNGSVVNSATNIQTLNQDDIKPGESRDQEFDAFLVGDRGNIKTASVKLDFDAGDIQSPFEKTAQLSTTISDAPLSLTLDAPPSAVSGDAISYIFDYRNQTQNDITDLKLNFKYPDGFSVTKTSPSPTAGNSTFSIPLLKAGSGQRVTITGRLSGNQNDSKTVTATIQHGINGTYVDYEKTSATTVISSPLLNVDTTVNGSASYVSHAGDTLQYQINYQNNSTYTFTGLVLSVKLDGSMYDFTSIDPKSGFYDASSHTVTWNSTAVSAFNSLAPNQGGTVNFSIKLRGSPVSGGSNSLFAHASVTLTTPNVPSDIQADSITTTDDILTKITSQPTFREVMYYNDPSFGSTGPMPPKAGIATVYTIHWQVTNPGNTLNNAKIVGTLPQGVTWKNVVSVGAGQPQPSFNSNTSQVTWNLGTLPAGAGTNGAAMYELSFQVSVKPSTTQVNQPAPVISGVTLTGTDSSTGQNIAVNALDLTTNSTVDQPGQGTVQQ